jgi:hypothetical protein
MKIQIQNEGVHSVLAIDPGGTTGVFGGWVDLKPTMKQTMLTGLLSRKAEEVTGSWLEQVNKLAAIAMSFHFASKESLIPMQNRHVVCEDFVLRRRQQGGATGNLTSVWVAAGFAAVINEVAMVGWQQPSSAKTFASDDRLRLWGLWIPGSAHKRDAARHFALKVNLLVG